MKFVDTYRFSPTIYMKDLPWEEDLFHISWEDIPRNKKERTKFIKENDIIIDYDWWKKQADRCRNGYTVENAIEPGGDAIRDGIECIWKHNDCYLEDYDITIKDRSVHISGRFYFYLNFWPIYGLEKEGTVKKIIKPYFIDLDYLFDLRVKNMYRYEKDTQELKGRQTGYELPDSEMILCKDGWKRNGDIVIGDLVATRNGTYTRVLNIHKQGIKDVYEIELMDGRKVRCGLNHKWKVYSKFSRKKCEVVKTTEGLINSGLYWSVNNGNNKSYKYAIPDIEAVPFEIKELPIDPYIMGLLLGDGDFGNSVRLSTVDIEIAETVSNILGSEYVLTPEYSSAYGKKVITRYLIKYIGKHTKELKKKYGLKSIINKFNPIKQEIRLLELLDKTAYTKSIPDIYKHASIEQRIELIRGLMDSDGHISPTGKMEYKTVSRQLADDITYVLRSLGVGVVSNEFESKQGYVNFYKIYIRLTKFNPFRLKRKAERFGVNREIYKRTSIVDIKKLEYQESSTCIEVEDTDRIYLTTDFIPTHNSEKSAGMMLGWNYTFLPGSVNLIVAGLQEDADHTMENTIRGLDMLINTQFYLNRRRGGDSKDTIISVNGSQVRSQTAKDKPQTLSRYSPTYVLYEEVGKGKKGWSLEVAHYVKPSLYTQGKKTGYSEYIGTGGDIEEGVYDLEERYFKPDKYNVLSFKRRHTQEHNDSFGKVGALTPKWMFLKTDKDGNSLRKESIAYLEKGGIGLNDEDRYFYWSQHCIYDHQIFMTQSGGYFGKDIIITLNQRKIEIKNRQELQIERKGILEPIDPNNIWKGVKFVDKQEGHWITIIEEPEKDKDGKVYANLYKAGIDSYDRDEALTSASKGAFHVRKMYRKGQESPHYNTFVSSIVERPKTSEGGAEKFYYHTILGCIYYGCRANVEYGANNMRIFDYYIKNGFEVLLKERPEIAFAGQIKRSMISNRYGTDESLKHQGLAILKNSLTPEFINRMFLLDQIEAFSRFKLDKDYNCDITMSSMEAEIIAKDEELYVVFSQTEQNINKTKGLRVFERVDGRLMQKII